ncbi:MAG: transcription termination factor Rho, partial [Nitriliruptoraceae bacterium]
RKADLVDLIIDTATASAGTSSSDAASSAGSGDDATASNGDGKPEGGKAAAAEQHDEQGRSGRGQADEERRDAEVRTGVLDLLPEGYGFLRCTGYLAGPKDVYVSQSFVRRLDLRRGDLISGPIRRNRNSDKFPALAHVDTVEGAPLPKDPNERRRPRFGDLTPLFPEERFHLETEDGSPMAMRLIDLMAPVGKGQRGLLVSPPKAGKTTVLKQLANAIETNHPDTDVLVLLVDERPEEVTDFERSIRGEVVSSTFDRPADDHAAVAELTIERAKRLVERGRDVVVLLDSITRLGRAYNLTVPTSGRILSGGIDSAALYPPKRFFGAARNLEEGGSLTIIATALVETGSRMDEVIFEEFKGTGNMELRLDRRLEQKRIFPAIDIAASGTRREELLLSEGELEVVWKLRRLLSTMETEAALQLLVDKLQATRSNEQFLEMIARSNLQ